MIPLKMADRQTQVAVFKQMIYIFVKSACCVFYLDVHGSMHRNINLIEITKKMQTCSRIYYSKVS